MEKFIQGLCDYYAMPITGVELNFKHNELGCKVIKSNVDEFELYVEGNKEITSKNVKEFEVEVIKYFNAHKIVEEK